MLLIFVVLGAPPGIRDETAKHHHSRTQASGNGSRIAIVSFRWDHVEGPYVVAGGVLLAFLSKLGKSKISGLSAFV